MFKRLLETIIGPIMDVVSEVVLDKDEQARIRADITAKLIDQETSLVEASRDVVVAEAKGSWLQRNWRPSLMFCFIGILANNYIIVPWLLAFGIETVAILDFPGEFWGLLTVGVGGYIAGRTIEKTESGVKINVGQNQKEP